MGGGRLSLKARRDGAAGDDGYRSLAATARERALEGPSTVAMRHKSLGIWREHTWGEVWEEVLTVANGLLSVGVEPGDRVSIQFGNRPEWVVLDLAIVAIRGITVGVYAGHAPAVRARVLADSRPRVHVLETRRQAEELVATSGSTLDVRRLIVLEPSGLDGPTDDLVMSWEEVRSAGLSHRDRNPGLVERLMAEAEGTDLASIVYTPGTTGSPKGVVLTNEGVAFAGERHVRMAFGGRRPGPRDEILSHLPQAHIGGRLSSTWTAVSTGAVLDFARSADTIREDLREVQPSLVYATPRTWEQIHATIVIRGMDATWFKRLWLGVGLRMAGRIGRARVDNGGRHTLESRLLSIVAHLAVLRALRERVGLRWCRWAVSGGPISPELVGFFQGLGIDLREAYVTTETAGVGTQRGRLQLDGVGEPDPEVGLRLDAITGEIQMRVPQVFVGYWNRPGETERAVTVDGWLRTGDLGEWDGDHLRIVDRLDYLFVTAAGDRVAPSQIEDSLAASPYVRRAVVVGHDRSYLTALVEIDADTVADWATRRGVAYSTHRDLDERPEVAELVQGVVDSTNRRLGRRETIRRFRLVDLGSESGLLTPMETLRRGEVEVVFAELIEAMYE